MVLGQWCKALPQRNLAAPSSSHQKARGRARKSKETHLILLMSNMSGVATKKKAYRFGKANSRARMLLCRKYIHFAPRRGSSLVQLRRAGGSYKKKTKDLHAPDNLSITPYQRQMLPIMVALHPVQFFFFFLWQLDYWQAPQEILYPFCSRSGGGGSYSETLRMSIKFLPGRPAAL